MKRTLVMGAAALATVALAAGCNNSSSAPASSPADQPTTTAPASPAVSNQAHNNADVMFAQHMIPHHQQAVEMSDMLLAKQGIDQRVTDLATQIKAAQAPEIQQMQGWLTAWGSPPMPPMSSMPQMSGDMGHGGMGDMPGMPAMQGMMSDADMNALRDAQGVEAAKLFLTQMTAHHEGAITMAQNEIKDGQYPDAITMSHAIVTTQQQEIDTMRAILGTL
jgi:uncharacterized protein (DUF305 family)